mmetsp:Transcript_42377/g.119855  ORF Transcript_42377/g.119855 Transcript_42377/m.119855 type:complete len:297 (+) Transcript_42377:460-1350(+)
MSASAESAQSGGLFLTASARLFLTHVKQKLRSSCVNPTLSSGPQSPAKSCISDSRRVADLNLVLESSAHFGFTNSGTMPPVVSKHRTYLGSWKTRTLMLPGYGEKPLSSATSPPVGVDLSKGSSMLYSTLMVVLLPSAPVNLQMPPHASPGMRGTVREFMVKSRRMETPRIAQKLRKGRGLVSWKSSSHLRPSPTHLPATPFWWRSACTSPWPCGFVSTFPSFAEIRASTSISAGTFSCCMTVIWSAAMPKFLFAARSSTVWPCVSPDVMIARGSTRLSFPVAVRAYAWNARMKSA